MGNDTKESCTPLGPVSDSLNCSSARLCDIGGLHTLLALHQDLTVCYAGQVLPGVVVLNSSLMDKDVLFDVMSADKAISGLDVESFYNSLVAISF